MGKEELIALPLLALRADSYPKLYELLWLPRVYVTRLPKLEQKRDLKRFQLHFGVLFDPVPQVLKFTTFFHIFFADFFTKLF